MIAEWSTPPTRPALTEGEVHVWLAHLPSAHGELGKLRGLLTLDETERAGRFRNELLRTRWELTRGILRGLLADYLDLSTREVVFQLGPRGKPALVCHPQFFFNTSHTGDYAAFAFTLAGETGVDIEQLRDDWHRHDAIAHRLFAPGERAELAAVPESERMRAFLDLWTRKEAFVKARGDGVFSGLEKFTVSLRHAGLVQITEGQPKEWWMCTMPEITGATGAVVVKAATCRARFWSWNAAHSPPA